MHRMTQKEWHSAEISPEEQIFALLPGPPVLCLPTCLPRTCVGCAGLASSRLVLSLVLVFALELFQSSWASTIPTFVPGNDFLESWKILSLFSPVVVCYSRGEKIRKLFLSVFLSLSSHLGIVYVLTLCSYGHSHSVGRDGGQACLTDGWFFPVFLNVIRYMRGISLSLSLSLLKTLWAKKVHSCLNTCSILHFSFSSERVWHVYIPWTNERCSNRPNNRDDDYDQ